MLKFQFFKQLCDFGQSLIFDDNFFSFYTVTGSIGFCAPELLTRKGNFGVNLECEHKIESFYISDVWSLGITLFCLIYGNVGFFVIDSLVCCKCYGTY